MRSEFLLGNEISLQCIARRLKLEVEIHKYLGESEVFLAFSDKHGRSVIDKIDAIHDLHDQKISSQELSRPKNKTPIFKYL